MDSLGAGFVVIVFLLISLGAFALWIWSLVDAIRVPDDSAFRAGTKVIWVVVIAVTGVVGSIIYLVVGRPRAA